MSETIERKLELGKRYNFPQLSTKDVEVLETIECYIEFYEKEFVWSCEYRALWREEENEETKAIEDIEKHHCWRYTVERKTIVAIELLYVNYPDGLWFVKIFTSGIDVVSQLAFNTKEKAERMYKYFCQYKGFEHY